MKYIEKSGKTVDEAVELALKELKATKEDVDIEIMEEAKGFLGIFGSKEIKVRVSLKKGDFVSEAEGFLKEVVEKIGIDGEVVSSYDEENKRIKMEIKGDGLGLIIGRRGETLDALQYLTNIVANKKSDDYVKVSIDAEDYRKRREDTLVSLAKRTASKAVKYKKNMIIEPKNPYERRIIHETLQSFEGVTTYSIGEEPNRKVVVAYKGMAGGYREEQ